MTQEEAIGRLCDTIEKELKGIKAQLESIYTVLKDEADSRRGF
jgi:hypothetical protein